ncbi:hypothetical protein D8Y22_22090 [Salinadaptatus halalkaliphilus]|uniref:Uncharacterized protein n=1 Tax=Salinadaptatus halalkaliphilus TaxID=2419781 RepID=A0A4S3TH05_9EURY|nr:hypothetical protein [Salinadaptatus halalkaliphilus]THE62760.1 hypothetical protein D8Y22_22090 [Salinadaptatus halalkaliphilus]
MSTASVTVGVGEPAQTVAIARLLASLVIGLASGVLLYYLTQYVRHVLATGVSYEWWYLLVGIGAGVVYAVAGIAELAVEGEQLEPFTDGAILFFILFLALGIRAMYLAEPGGDRRSSPVPVWVDYGVVAVFVLAWWGTYLVDTTWTRPVVAVGWIVTSVWAVFYGVQTVRAHEGTTIAALTRHLLPAILCIVAVVFVDLLTGILEVDPAIADAAWIVGTTLVGAFLFNTAVAIRQQGGELERMYDWTTWREQRYDRSE